MYFTNFTRGGGSKREERGRSSKRGKNTNQTNPYLHQGYDDSTSDTGHGTSQSNIPIGSSSEHDIGPTAQPISNELQNLDLFGNYPFHFQSWAATNPTDLPLDNFDIFGHDLDQFSLPVDPSQTTFSDQTFQQESVPEPETVPNQNARYNLFKKYIEQLPISSEIYEVIEEENDYYIYCNKCGVKVNQKNYSIGNRVKVILKTHNNKYHGGYLTEEHKNELKKWLKELGQEGKYFKIEENTNNLICKVCDVKLTPYDKKAMTYHLETDKHIIAFNDYEPEPEENLALESTDQNETKHLSKGKMFQQYIEQLPIDSEIYEVIEEENDYYIYCNKCGVKVNDGNYGKNYEMKRRLNNHNNRLHRGKSTEDYKNELINWVACLNERECLQIEKTEKEEYILHCNICHMKLSPGSKSVIEDHLKRSKHKNALKNIRFSSEIPSNQEDEKAEKSQLLNENKKYFDIQGKCTLCNKELKRKDKNSLLRHIMSKGHKGNLKKEYKKQLEHNPHQEPTIQDQYQEQHLSQPSQSLHDDYQQSTQLPPLPEYFQPFYENQFEQPPPHYGSTQYPQHYYHQNPTLTGYYGQGYNIPPHYQQSEEEYQNQLAQAQYESAQLIPPSHYQQHQGSIIRDPQQQQNLTLQSQSSSDPKGKGKQKDPRYR